MSESIVLHSDALYRLLLNTSELARTDMLVLSVLCQDARICDNSGALEVVIPDQEYLARRCHKAKTQISASLNRLCKGGFITKHPQIRRTYIFNHDCFRATPDPGADPALS